MQTHHEQLLENECKHFFVNNKNSYETVNSLSLRLGRTEDQVKFTLEVLVSKCFLEIQDVGSHKIFYLNKKDESNDIVIKTEFPIEKKIGEIDILSVREKEVLFHLLNGSNNGAIAEELFISIHTVKNHVTKIFKKLDVSDRVQLMKKIYEKI